MSLSLADKKINADALKAEGNALHVKGDHKGAYDKYSQAIKLDDQNAVLFANRAAASIAMKEYLDAGSDAYKATQLDPKYSKAWARLAVATQELFLLDKSATAWKRALKCLPDKDLSESELRLKQQYEAGLKKAIDSEAEATKQNMDPEDLYIVSYGEEDIASGKLPWHRALAMEAELSKGRIYNSSAWVIMNAHRDFDHGTKIMKMTKKYDDHVEGKPQAIAELTNGLLRDERAFCADGSQWFEMLEVQAAFEGDVLGGWPQGGPTRLMEEAPKRLKAQGWTAARRGVSFTVRNWILHAHIASHTFPEQRTSLQLYNAAVTVLEWGSRTWKNVPKDDRGAIFEKTFIRGVKRLQLNAYIKAYKDPGAAINLEQIMTMAQEMIEELEANRITNLSEIDPGFMLSFWHYPMATAHAALGFCQMAMAMQAKNDDKETAHSYFAEAEHSYMRAAASYPQDDEMHPYFLKIAFETYWHRGLPLSTSLALCRRIRSVLPDVAKIWLLSPFSQTLSRHLKQLFRFESEATSGLLEGKFTKDTPSSSIPFA